jgi:hypothetical protein
MLKSLIAEIWPEGEDEARERISKRGEVDGLPPERMAKTWKPLK